MKQGKLITQSNIKGLHLCFKQDCWKVINRYILFCTRGNNLLCNWQSTSKKDENVHRNTNGLLNTINVPIHFILYSLKKLKINIVRVNFAFAFSIFHTSLFHHKWTINLKQPLFLYHIKTPFKKRKEIYYKLLCWDIRLLINQINFLY